MLYCAAFIVVLVSTVWGCGLPKQLVNMVASAIVSLHDWCWADVYLGVRSHLTPISTIVHR